MFCICLSSFADICLPSRFIIYFYPSKDLQLLFSFYKFVINLINPSTISRCDKSCQKMLFYKETHFDVFSFFIHGPPIYWLDTEVLKLSCSRNTNFDILNYSKKKSISHLNTLQFRLHKIYTFLYLIHYIFGFLLYLRVILLSRNRRNSESLCKQIY